VTDRVERLTNLLALLLETREPLSLQQVASEMDGQYPEAHVARRAAFERDKAALRDIGVPIDQEIVLGGPYAGQTRYWIDRERYELRGLQLDEDEGRALQVAMAATRPGSTSGQEALWKLGAGLLDRSAPVSAVLPDLPELPVLRDAVSRRTSVGFDYRDVRRTVDPWGLLLRDGFWYLVGFDHARGERRTFRIDRIASDIEVLDGRTFERPEGFDPRDAMPSDPKLIGAGESGADARVRIEAARAGAAVAELGEHRVVARDADGSVEVDVPCGNLPAFRSWLLGFLEHAEVLSPPDVRAHVIEWLEAAGR
jgi:predicted DNA-binding transcriptional regulator YafY